MGILDSFIDAVTGNAQANAAENAAKQSAKAQMYATDRTIEAQQEATDKAIAAAKKGNALATRYMAGGATFKRTTAEAGDKLRDKAGNVIRTTAEAGDTLRDETGAVIRDNDGNPVLAKGGEVVRDKTGKRVADLAQGGEILRDKDGNVIKERTGWKPGAIQIARDHEIAGAQRQSTKLLGANADSADAKVGGLRDATSATVKGLQQGKDATVAGLGDAKDSLVNVNLKNIDFFKDIYNQQTTALRDWRTVGKQAIKTLGDGLSEAELKQDPGYQFRLEQGNQALDRSAAARGGLLSGAQIAASTDFNSGMASQEYQNAWDRYLALADRGQQAVNDTNAARDTLASRVGSSRLNIGDARADFHTGRGAARSDFYTGRGDARSDMFMGIGAARADEATGSGNIIANRIGTIANSRAGAAGDIGRARAQGALNVANAAATGATDMGSVLARGYQANADAKAGQAAVGAAAGALRWDAAGDAISDGANWLLERLRGSG
jgi:hypothetical protein